MAWPHGDEHAIGPVLPCACSLDPHPLLSVPSTPSRAATLIGMFPLNIGMQHKIVENDKPYGLTLDLTTMPELMKAAGYRTASIGKVREENAMTERIAFTCTWNTDGPSRHSPPS